MNKGVKRYCRRVSRKLTARRETRRRLTDGLAAEICETLGESCTESEITVAFGPPERTAEELQLGLSEAETNAFRKAWKVHGIALAALCLTLAAAILVLILYGASNSAVFSDADVHYIDTETGGKIDETGFVFGADGSHVPHDGDLRLCRQLGDRTD